MKPYYNPTKRIIENGSLFQIADLLTHEKSKKILLVMGGKSFKSTSHYLKLKKVLSEFNVAESEPVQENPKVGFVESFVEQYRAGAFDTVVGIGGGSVLDVAKISAVLLSSPQNALTDYIQSHKRFSSARKKLIVVPTTSGTGSEVTPYASLESSEKKKITVTNDQLYADWALIDPVLCETMPAYVTAATGMDALSQSIEAFWSVHHTPFSDSHAVQSISLILPNIRRAVNHPLDNAARFAMALGSCESGLAIAQTATTAVHAVSYPITTLYGVAHGHACALTLAEFLRFNQCVMNERRYDDLWKAMGVSSADEAARVIEDLMESLGLERRLSKLGIPIDPIIENGFRADRVKNNPRELTPKALLEILKRIQ